jgi:alkylation response protein AidB-like acyl-CoA dehydrogenase
VSALQASEAAPLTHEAVLDSARRVRDEIATRADQHDRAGDFATENIDALWAASLGNLTVPAADGGAGASLATTAAAVELIGAGDASTALVWVMHLIHMRLATDPESGWPEHLRRRVVAESLAGPALINALRVEPELGTPARGGIPATVARPATTADGSPAWSITGRKIYSTGSFGLRWMAVFGATAPDGDRPIKVGTFLVPADTPGITIEATWDHLGMRASASHDVVLADVVIPADHAIGLAPPGSDPASRSGVQMGWMTALLVSIYQGVAIAARDWLIRYLGERTPSNLGAPLASLPRFQTAVGEIEARLHTNRRLLGGLISDVELRGVGSDAALVKVTATRNAIASVESALALIGNPGLSYRHPLQRHYRDVLCSRIHTPQDDAVLLGTGKALLGLGSSS